MPFILCEPCIESAPDRGLALRRLQLDEPTQGLVLHGIEQWPSKSAGAAAFGVVTLAHY
jgi:hypothetical protein